MTVEQNQRIKTLFEFLLDHSPIERAALLETHCAEDVEVRAEVAALLRAHDEAADFLADSPFDSFKFKSDSAASFDFVGRRIGPYQLRGEIGHGGMATVYLAERVDGEYRRQVALKLVWPSGDAGEITRRFKRERQILARLDHPNIARLLDGGTTSEGWPYLVMEYIAGQPITHYCRARNLRLVERLQLFQTVCAAVAYAHRNLVVHRDIKPSNILVTEEGTAKLLDFGIAKLLAPDADGETPPTLKGLRPMTPEYASPEQLREEAVTTATDIYSLGVLLHELLTGAHPHDLKDHPLPELTRIVCEQDPPPPSARVKQLRGDLDNIVLLALRKDPCRRYQTVEQFSEDISRHLAGKTVNARPATWFYRAGKFVRRNRLLMTVLLFALTVLLSAGTVYIRGQYRRQELEREQRYTQLVRLAGQDLENGEGLNLRALADRYAALPGQTDVRGFEWEYLRQAGRRHLATLSHPEWVRDATFSPDGKLLATAFAQTIWFWDTATRRRIASIAAADSVDGHVAPIRDLDFSPDGKLLAGIGEDRGVNLWDVATHTRKQRIKLPGPFFGAVIGFSPNGKYLTASSGTPISENAIVHLWELGADGTATRKLPLQARTTDWAYGIGFSPDSTLMAIPAAPDRVVLRETATGKTHNILRTGLGDVHTAVFSGDGKLLAVGCYENAARIFDSRTGRQLRTLIGHQSSVYSLAFTPNRQRLVTGSSDRTAKLWDVAIGVELANFSGHTNEVLGVCISPDGRTMATSGNDGTVRLWDLSIPYAPVVLRNPNGKVQALAWLPESSQLLTAQEGGEVKLWDVERGVALETWLRQTEPSPTFSVSSDGRHLALRRTFQEIQLWNLSTRQIVNTLHGRNIRALALAPSGGRLAIAHQDGAVSISDTATGASPPARQPMPGDTDCLAFSPDGLRLATAGSDYRVHLWEAATGRFLTSFAGHTAPIHTLLFDSNGARILTAGADQTAILWDARTGARLHTLRGHVDEVTSAAFSPDGKRLATGSLDKTIRLWNAATGEDLLIFRDNPAPISALSFSPDGRILAGGAWDGTIRFWRAN